RVARRPARRAARTPLRARATGGRTGAPVNDRRLIARLITGNPRLTARVLYLFWIAEIGGGFGRTILCDTGLGRSLRRRSRRLPRRRRPRSLSIPRELLGLPRLRADARPCVRREPRNGDVLRRRERRARRSAPAGRRLPASGLRRAA